MNTLPSRKMSYESLGDLVLRTNNLAHAHILAVRTRGRYGMAMQRLEKSVSLDSDIDKSETVEGFSPSSLELTQKVYKEYWDILGLDGQDVILRRKLLNGVNEEFVLDKDEMESKGLTGLRSGRRIEVSEDPETGKIKYELQRYTRLETTPLLRSILDAEKKAKQTEGVTEEGKVTADSGNHAEGEVSEKEPDAEDTRTVYIWGNDGI